MTMNFNMKNNIADETKKNKLKNNNNYYYDNIQNTISCSCTVLPVTNLMMLISLVKHKIQVENYILQL